MCNGYILALKYTSRFDCRNVLVTFYDGMKKEFEFCARVKKMKDIWKHELENNLVSDRNKKD